MAEPLECERLGDPGGELPHRVGSATSPGRREGRLTGRGRLGRHVAGPAAVRSLLRPSVARRRQPAEEPHRPFDPFSASWASVQLRLPRRRSGAGVLVQRVAVVREICGSYLVYDPQYRPIPTSLRP